MESHKLWQIVEALEEHFPLESQESWDNSGLQIGNPDDDINGVLFALDVCEELLDKAVQTNSNLIITHHPLLFNPIKSVTTTDWKGRIITKAIRNNINIYSCHTPADKGEGGLNSWIAQQLELVSPVHLTDDHIGLIGALKKPMSPSDFSSKLKKIFGLNCLEASYAYSQEEVRIIALCSGSGMSLVKDAIDKGADTFITGDISWGKFSEWRSEINLCNITHFNSEKQFATIALDIIKKKFPKFALQCQNLCLTEYW